MDKESKQFINIVRQIISQETKKQSCVVPYYGTVTECNNGTNCEIGARCTVQLTTYNSYAYDILNQSNTILNINDKVLILAVNNSLSNAYISMKIGG